MTSGFQDSIEREITLVVSSETPRGIIDQISLLRSIGRYRLVPRNSETIHDFYFDTPDRLLANQLLALRVRRVDTNFFLTLKDRAQPSDWGGVERFEVELSWSHDALVRCVEELMDRGINIRYQSSDFDFVSPQVVMQNLNLVVVQNRTIDRKVRHVILHEGDGLVFAELTIDSVTYHFRNLEVHHHEMEVEAKEKHISIELRTLVERLIKMYKPALREWIHSKVAIGKVVERLLDEGNLKNLLDFNNNLLPVAYDKIVDCLKPNRVND